MARRLYVLAAGGRHPWKVERRESIRDDGRKFFVAWRRYFLWYDKALKCALRGNEKLCKQGTLHHPGVGRG